MLSGVKKAAKQKLASLLVKLLEEQNVKNWLDNHLSSPTSLPMDLFKSKAPYPECEYNSPSQQKTSANQPIIITSRFRSGSTLLWNLFRNIESCTAYYEPFNERQWFNPALRGEHVDNTHRGVTDYWAEFKNLDQLSNYYDEAWVKSRFLMTESCWDENMWHFINMMIEKAPQRAVMQFNRIDFRLPWLKKNFNQAKFVHLYRHPRDQWCSFLTKPEQMTASTIEQTYEDNFYLDSWCDDLQTHFPFLNREVTPHPYQRFYLLWTMSYLFGRYYSDVSISFESLTQNPIEQITKLFNTVELPLDDVETLTKIISPPKADRWKSYAKEEWFKQHEEVCHRILERWTSTNIWRSHS